MRRKYSLSLATAVEALIKKENVFYTFDHKEGLFCITVPLDGAGLLDIHIRIYDSEITMYGIYPFYSGILQDKRKQELLLYLTLANSALRNGNFEIDLATGLIRYKCFLDCGGLDAPTEEMFHHAFQCLQIMYQRYELGFRKLQAEGISAREAYSLCNALERSYYAANNERSPAESAAAAGIAVPWDLLYDEDNSDLKELIADMYADDNIL